MFKNKSVAQIEKNIWRITRAEAEPVKRDSLFVLESAKDFIPHPEYQCTEREDGLLTFLLDGNPVLSERMTDETVAFSIGETDGIYGLGIHQHQSFNRRNMTCQMVQKNGEITAVPFLTSTGGYAILFDTCSYMSIGIDRPCCRAHSHVFDSPFVLKNQIHVYAEDADVFTYYIIMGKSMDEQISGYRRITGKSPLFPQWAYGFFQSREHYQTQEELLSVAHEFRRRHIPIDCIVQDWNYWGDLGWNAVEWDHKKYPNPKKMIDEIHDLDMKFMISVWPSFGKETHIVHELEAVNGILEKPDQSGENWGRVHDPLNPKAVDILWRYIDQNLLQAGVDAWWLDSTEPAFENDSSLHLLECKPGAFGPNTRHINHYALCCARNIYEKQRTANDQRVYILTRSGYAGQQAYAASTWTGDIDASWTVFREQIASLLSYSASGIPYSTTDIGAFFVEYEGGNQNSEYRELYTRWFWFGAFSPIFRSHGTSTDREMWFFGEPGTEYYDAQIAASRLRYMLMPYLYAAAFRVYADDYTLMRPLVMDYADDAAVQDIWDSYMFGDSLLVHIVTAYQVRTAEVYLPKGNNWIDFYTNQQYTGGQKVSVEAPLNQTPLFVREGSLILMAEPAECTAWQTNDILKLHIFTGGNCEAFYYADDGRTYAYEKNDFVRIVFQWNDSSHTLFISAPEGVWTNKKIPCLMEIYQNGMLCTTVNYPKKAMEILL